MLSCFFFLSCAFLFLFVCVFIRDPFMSSMLFQENLYKFSKQSITCIIETGTSSIELSTLCV